MKAKLMTMIVLASLLLVSCSTVEQLNTGEATQSPTQTPQMEVPTQPAQIDAGLVAGLDGVQQGLRDIYNSVLPSVVHVRVEKTETVSGFEFSDLFPYQFGDPFGQQGQQERKVTGQGSGFIWDAEGYIVTNNHVVDGADKITVTFHDGTSTPAEVVGTDSESDLAVIKVDPEVTALKPVVMGDSTKVQVGDLAIAIGNPYGLQGTMTVGIVSALGRSLSVDSSDITTGQYTIPDVIQTDASINPGNSGGVLTDIQGQVIGVTSAIESSTGSNAGIGFVIPSIIVKNVVPALITDGNYQHTYIGISGQTLTSDTALAMDLPNTQRGVLVINVQPDSPAEEAGLQGSDETTTIDDVEYRLGGDVVTAINEQPVNDFEDLVAYLARYTSVGDKVTLHVIRDGKETNVELTLAARPSSRVEDSGTARTMPDNNQVWLGIQGMDMTSEVAKAMSLDENQTGVLVQQVTQNSPADKASLRGSFKPVTIDGQEVLVGGDVIVALNNEQVKSISGLQEMLAGFKAGDTITLTVLRNGSEVSVDVQLESR